MDHLSVTPSRSASRLKTLPRKIWLIHFRYYGLSEAFFGRTWKPDDLEKIRVHGSPGATPHQCKEALCLATGNFNGDIHMLWYSQTSPYRSLQLLLRHDDGKREYAYDAGAEKAQQLAAVRNWQVISMQQDFLRVFTVE